MLRSLVIQTLAVAGLAVGAMAAHAQPAQEPRPEFVQAQLERTDVRIEQAQSIVRTADNSPASGQLSAAVDLQARAKESFSSQNYSLSLRLTLEARGHADRAIAIVKNLPDPDRVKAQLDRTQELLERAREAIQECNNDRARAMLEAAFEMQGRAVEAARNGHYLVSLQLTVGARERALKALRLCNLEESLQEGADRQIQQTDDAISRARETLETCQNEQARASLAQAMELQEQAKSEFRAERFRPALKLTQIARRAAYRSIQLCGR
jgi:hypothetical protein